jgi:phospholipid/cholesterol/gamma-HCH transport system permease protein
MLTKLGRRTIGALVFLGEVILIIFRSLLELPGFFRTGFRPVARVLLKQILFTGVHAWGVIVVLFFLIGALVITQIIGFAGVGGASLTGKVLVWIVVMEIGPLLTAVIVIARSGSAIAAELASMKINEELGALEAMGIPVDRYLVMPRVVGVAVSVAVLALYAEAVAIGGGFLFGSITWKIPLADFREGLLPLSTLRAVALSSFKSFAFGLVIAAACCRQGLSVEGGFTQIPVAATKGVMRSLLMIFLLDAFVAVATFA